ncbi:hypothetical protein B0H11DRAFT_1933432 [Mycena galericulata]|nr:hypothetical protein B0H11DRAFT_1933432 [Mycena galericulata]
MGNDGFCWPTGGNYTAKKTSLNQLNMSKISSTHQTLTIEKRWLILGFGGYNPTTHNEVQRKSMGNSGYCLGTLVNEFQWSPAVAMGWYIKFTAGQRPAVVAPINYWCQLLGTSQSDVYQYCCRISANPPTLYPLNNELSLNAIKVTKFRENTRSNEVTKVGTTQACSGTWNFDDLDATGGKGHIIASNDATISGGNNGNRGIY